MATIININFNAFLQYRPGSYIKLPIRASCGWNGLIWVNWPIERRRIMTEIQHCKSVWKNILDFGNNVINYPWTIQIKWAYKWSHKPFSRLTGNELWTVLIISNSVIFKAKTVKHLLVPASFLLPVFAIYEMKKMWVLETETIWRLGLWEVLMGIL